MSYSSNPSRSWHLSKVELLSRECFNQAHHNGIMGAVCSVGPGRNLTLLPSGNSVVDYTRCGYLHLDSHPAVIAGAKGCLDAAQSVHYSVARTRLTHSALDRLEDRLAHLFGVRSVVVFPTVAAANMGCLPLLAAGLFTSGQKPILAFDRFSHVTLQYHIPVLRQETEVIVIGHNDLDHLEALCQANKPVAYVADGAYSMGRGAAPVAAIRQLQERYGLFTYFDDAHGISVAGRHGEGFVRSQLGLLGDKTVIAASLGKGYGASGGLIMLGSDEQELAVRRFAPTYAFSCAPNMAAVGAALASAEIHATPELPHLQHGLQENLRLLDRLLPTENAGSQLPIRIFRIGDENSAIEAASVLLQEGHLVSAVFFPTVPRGKAAIRTSITVAHTPADLMELARLLKPLLSGLPVQATHPKIAA